MQRLPVIAVLASVTLLAGCNGGNGDAGLTLPAPPPATGTIYAFGATGSPANDGAEPKGSLTAVTQNGGTVLFGRTAIGGSIGCGTIFSVNPDGSSYNLQYRFADNVLYGISRSDGTLPDGKPGQGAVFSFKLATPLANGPITVLHTFAGGANDGALSDHGYLTPVSVGGKTIFFGLTQCGGPGTGKDACGSSDGGGDGAPGPSPDNPAITGNGTVFAIPLPN